MHPVSEQLKGPTTNFYGTYFFSVMVFGIVENAAGHL